MASAAEASIGQPEDLSVPEVSPSVRDASCSEHYNHLKHGNPAGDPSTAPRCGAKTRNGGKCGAPAMRNPKTGRYTRCRMHGGSSTGPQTPEGLERCRKARWQHGRRSEDATCARKQRTFAKRQAHAELRRLERLLRSLHSRRATSSRIRARSASLCKICTKNS
jgi:glucans biosynthesis protein